MVNATPQHVIPGKSPSTQHTQPEWTQRPVSTGVGKGKSLAPTTVRTPEPPSLQGVAVLTTLSEPPHANVCYNEVQWTLHNLPTWTVPPI